SPCLARRLPIRSRRLLCLPAPGGRERRPSECRPNLGNRQFAQVPPCSAKSQTKSSDTLVGVGGMKRDRRDSELGCAITLSPRLPRRDTPLGDGRPRHRASTAGSPLPSTRALQQCGLPVQHVLEPQDPLGSITCSSPPNLLDF